MRRKPKKAVDTENYSLAKHHTYGWVVSSVLPKLQADLVQAKTQTEIENAKMHLKNWGRIARGIESMKSGKLVVIDEYAPPEPERPAAPAVEDMVHTFLEQAIRGRSLL